MTTHQTISISFLTSKSKLKIKLQLSLQKNCLVPALFVGALQSVAIGGL